VRIPAIVTADSGLSYRRFWFIVTGHDRPEYPDRKYAIGFRNAAVKQVNEGRRSMTAVARSLEMSSKTLANWVYRARKGHALVKQLPFLNMSCAHPRGQVSKG